jgi:hypothetical protein
MPIFEIQGPGGRSFQIEGPDQAGAVEAFKRFQASTPAVQRIEFEGQQHEFPADFTQADIAKALASAPATFGSRFSALPGAPEATEAPVSASGLGKAANIGLEKGISGIVGTPHVAANLIARGINAAQRGLGLPETQNVEANPFPMAEDVQARIEAAHPSGEFGKPYQPENRAERYTSSIGEFAPNLVLPGGIVGRVAQTVLPGVATEATREAGGGPLAQALAALAGGVGGAKLANMAERATATALPSLKALKDEAQATYKAVEDAAMQRPTLPSQRGALASDIEGELHAQNFRPNSSPDVYEELGKLREPGTAGRSTDVADLLTVRRNLKRIRGEQGPAARIAEDAVSAEIENRVPGALAALDKADQNYNVFKVGSELDKAAAKAELQTAGAHSGMNLGNKLRQMATSVATNERRTRYMRPEDVQALEGVARGTVMQGINRGVGNVLGGGGGLGGLIAGGLGFHFGGPLGLALGVAGVPFRMAYNRSVARSLQDALQTIRARAPFSIERGALPTRRLGVTRGGILGSLPALELLSQPER